MPRIGRDKYHKATSNILTCLGFEIKRIKLCKFLATNDRNERLFIDVAGKNLPYYGSKGQVAFPWETHIKAERLDRIQHEASLLKAKPYLAYCYCILESSFRDHFQTVTKIETTEFGLKVISVSDFKDHMQARSPNSWVAVELPRRKVLNYAIDPNRL